MIDLSAIVPADQLQAVLAALLCLEENGSELPAPLELDLVYLPCGDRTFAHETTTDGSSHKIELTWHENQLMRWLEGYPVETIVSSHFNLYFTFHVATHTEPGFVHITQLEDGSFDLLICELDENDMPPQLANFPVELLEVQTA